MARGTRTKQTWVLLAVAALTAPAVTGPPDAASVPDDSPTVTVAAPLDGIIDDTAPPVVLPNPAYAPTNPVARTCRVRVPTDGTYAIELRSYFFDSFLVLRDADGTVLAEDDDGLIELHSRIVHTFSAEQTYLVDVCALHGKRGPFELRVVPGAPAALSPRERTAAAIDDAQKAVAYLIKARGPESTEAATALNRLGVWFFEEGRYDEARAPYERALAIRRVALGPGHADTAMSQDNLASLLTAQGQYDEALPLFEQALVTRERELGPLARETATTLNNLARLLHKLGRFDEARRYFERALAIDEATLGPMHPDTATDLNNLAVLHKAQGRYDESRRLLERARVIWETALGPDHPLTANALNNLAFLNETQGRYADARPLHEQALAIRDAVLGPEHPSTAYSLNNLARVLADLGEFDAAWALLRRARLSRAAHLQRTLAGMSEHEAIRYVQMLFSQQESALSLARRIDDAAVHVEAYEGLLAWKGRVTRLAEQSRGRLETELTDEQTALIEELRDVQGALSTLVLRTNVPDPAARDARLESLRAQRNALELRWQRMLEVHSGPAVTFAQLRAGLPARSAVVDFFVHRVWNPGTPDGDASERAWSPAHLSVWITRPDTPAPVHVDLGPADAIEDAVRAFLEDLVARRGVRRTPAADARDPNAELRTLLWDPVAAHLGDAEFVFISPDQFVGTLPFETLERDDGRYLIEQTAFVYLQNVATLADLTQRAAGARTLDTLLSVGGVDFLLRNETPHAGNDAAPAPGDDVLRGSFTEFWGSLPATEYESQVVHDMHRAAFREGRRTLRQHGAATEEALKRDLPEHAVLHLATHGFFQPEGLPSMWEQVRRAGDDESDRTLEMRHADKRITGSHPGLLSGLVCSGASAGAEEGRDDGYLTAEEVSWLDLTGVHLVVLSACDTGLGRAAAGEGLIGLRRAFRTAGADCVVSSLWSVRDQATSELMQAFYRNLLLRKQGTLEALRTAQLAALEANRRKYDGDGRPSTWGAFVLDGDWR